MSDAPHTDPPDADPLNAARTTAEPADSEARSDQQASSWRDKIRGARAMLVGRYAASSVIAGVISELAFMISYGVGALPSVASVIAFVAGAVPNYLMNRYWAWQKRDRVRAGRELVPYIVIIIVTAIIASLVTTAADAWLHDRIESHIWQVILVGAAFLGTYGVMFILKFFLFDRFVFAGSKGSRSPATRSKS